MSWAGLDGLTVSEDKKHSRTNKCPGVPEFTPVIIKFVFHALTKENRLATYACINYGEAYAPGEIADRSIVINEDCGKVIEALLGQA